MTYCVIHPDKEAVALCNRCAKAVCPECLVGIKGESYCKECVSIKAGGEKKEERSPSLAAILSFVIGGLGQIYNGQIGKGILIFFTSWLIIPWVIGIIDAYKTANKINAGKIKTKARPGCLIATIICVAVFWIGVFFLALLAAIAIPSFLKAKSAANEELAKASAKDISAALENYKTAKGNYPISESELLTADPPYLAEAYNNRIIQGYIFTEILKPGGYEVIAQPEECGDTGDKVFTIKTAGVILENDCKE